VSAYGGSSKNLKDLKGLLNRAFRRRLQSLGRDITGAHDRLALKRDRSRPPSVPAWMSTSTSDACDSYVDSHLNALARSASSASPGMHARLLRGSPLRFKPTSVASFSCDEAAARLPSTNLLLGVLPKHIVAYNAPAVAREFHLTGCSSQESACLALFRGKPTPPEVLRAVAEFSAPGMFGENCPAAALLRVAVERRAGCEAFAMGHHQRLGAGSFVQDLDAGVVRMIFDQL
jgi:hypothetical protein